MRIIRIGGLAVLLAWAMPIGSTRAQAPTATPPQLAERDQMTLTILQQQLQIAILQLKIEGWHVEMVGGRWAYVPDVTEQKPPPE